MKISSVSKKVLASALSAAMVVAFTPVVALGAQGDVTLTNTNATTGAETSVQYSTIADAVKAAKKGDVLTLNADLAESFVLPAGADLTLNLNGHTLTATDKDADGTADVAYVISVAGASDAGSITMAAVGEYDGSSLPASSYVKALDQSQPGAKKIAEATEGTDTLVEDIDGVLYEKASASGTVNVYKGTTLYKFSTAKGSAAAKLTVKGEGTIDGESGLLGVTNTIAAAADTTVTLKGGTVKGEIAGGAADSGYAATVVIDGGTVTATAENRIDAVRAASLTLKSGKISATSTKGTAYAVVAQAATVTGGEIVATGNENSTALYDDDANNSVVNGGIITAVYNGTVANTKADALSGYVQVKGGTVNGELNGANIAITGGKFSEDLTNSALVQTGYRAFDDGKVSTVYVQTLAASQYDIADGMKYGQDAASGAYTAVPAAVKAGVEDVLDIVANPDTKGTAKVAYGEGWDAAKFAAVLADAKQSAALKVEGKFAAIDPKANNLTAEQKAVVEDMTAKAYELDSAVDTIYTQSLAITYKDPSVTNSKAVTVATITDLGTVKTGRETNARSLKLTNGTDAAIASTATVMDAAGAKVAYNTTASAYTSAMPTTFAVIHADANIIKDKLEGEINKPAPEKATQGIDVAKKSLTVKLGAKKSKTAKGKSFNMGASAETELTTAWKSGSTKITVSGDKVKLAKGAKRGTYTAKVSLKAAASDAYLAAAKTITVKFVIK